MDAIVESVNAIIKAVSEGNGAIVAAGLLTVPVANLLREVGNQWKWFKRKVKGVWMLVTVTGVSTLIVGVASFVPAVAMDFSIGPCLLAAATAVLARQAQKHGLDKK